VLSSRNGLLVALVMVRVLPSAVAVGLVGDVVGGGLGGELRAVGARDAVLERVGDLGAALLPALGHPRHDVAVGRDVGQGVVAEGHERALHERDARERGEAARVVVERHREGAARDGGCIPAGAAPGQGEYCRESGRRDGDALGAFRHVEPFVVAEVRMGGAC